MLQLLQAQPNKNWKTTDICYGPFLNMTNEVIAY